MCTGMHSATTRTRNTVGISCVSNQGCLQSNVLLMAFKEVQSSVPAEELHIGRMSIHHMGVHTKASSSGPWLHQVQGKTPCFKVDIKTSIQHKVVSVCPSHAEASAVHSFLKFFGNEIQNGSFILWCRTSAKSFQLVQYEHTQNLFQFHKNKFR